ncbi:MAG: T9SS type A sorting domain-containing protein [Rhodothermales bacterium]|nr:T9SS type A sorting domain-containing protein [Rhodothermales bacterium]
MPRLATLFVLLVLAAPAWAQQRLDAPARALADDGAVLHVSDWLNARPEARAALEDYHRRKDLGLLPAAKTSDDEVGDVRTFKVFNYTSQQLDQIEFEMVRDHARFQLWIEVAEKSVLSDATLDELVLELGSRTPAGSIDPSRGLIENDEEIFGLPPNVDGDGKTDILLVDIRDGCDGTSCFPVGGFFFGTDLSSAGNNRDVIYLDTKVARDAFTTLALTAAHEYQHLIHARYDRNEITFVNEGQSEYAEVMNGYPGRSMRYLGDATTYNVSFFRFLSNDDLRVLNDYQRAGLWTTYLAERIGPEAVGSITREPDGGITGYNTVLQPLGFSFTDLLLDFHTANLLNDPAVDARYGYETAQRQALQAVPSTTGDGRFALETPTTPLTVTDGAVQYATWKQVTDFELTLGVTSGEGLRIRLFIFNDGGVTEQNLAGGGTFAVAGHADRIALVLADVVLDNRNAFVDLSAAWTADQLYEAVSVVYDDGTVPRDENNVLAAFGLCDTTPPVPPCDSRQANRFDVPQGAIPASVSVAPYYDNEFAGSPVSDDAPRDFKLVIWGEKIIQRGGGDQGIPNNDDVLFELDVEDTRSNNGATLVFQEVDLAAYQDELAAAMEGRERVYIGLMDAGMDDNFLIMGVTEFDGNTDAANATSFLHLPSFFNGVDPWAAFAQLVVGGNPVLENRVIPVRAVFLVPSGGPVADEEAAEVPSAITLAPNYPNPFNPTTTIEFALPRTTDVRLSVYDLLGREVALLVDGLRAAGTHRVEVDAARWSSGLYLYRLEAGGQSQTRRMMLVK